jgi:hypothetical protein
MAKVKATTIPHRMRLCCYTPTKCKNCDQIYDKDTYSKCPYCSG